MKSARAAGVAVGLALAVGCACPTTAEPPPFLSCETPCEGNLVVVRSDGPEPVPFLDCVGFPDDRRPVCPRPTATGGDWRFGLDPSGVLVARPTFGIFEGYSLRLDAEPRDGGRARLCASWASDTGEHAVTGCEHDWFCAESGTVTLTPGGVAFHAVFGPSTTIDGAFLR